MKTSINALHHQGADWLRELEFYKEEIAILTKRLEEVAAANTTQDVAAQVEHFQNKFVVIREQLDILKHDIGKRNHEVQEAGKERPTHIDEKQTAANDGLFERMTDFTSDFANTRYQFNQFLARIF